MSNVPNYRALSPPTDKPPEDYTWAERRAELYDLIERAGHYRNLERSTRELGDRFGVSHTQIREDIQRINEWMAEHMGEGAEAELETLKNTAIQERLDDDDPAGAYSLMSSHYQTLMAAAAAKQRREADRQEVEHGGSVAVGDLSEDQEATFEALTGAPGSDRDTDADGEGTGE